MRILGIDPALSVTGFGVIDEINQGLSIVKIGIVKTNPKKLLADRLATIYKEISGVVQESRPDCIVLEKVYVHYRHQTTAFILGQARGVICLISAQMRLPLFEYAATRVKKSLVGAGLASKLQIKRMVCGMMALKQVPKYEDITDALALAIAHSHISKSRVL